VGSERSILCKWEDARGGQVGVIEPYYWRSWFAQRVAVTTQSLTVCHAMSSMPFQPMLLACLSIYLSICHLSVCLSDNVIRLFLGVLYTIDECRGRTHYTMVTPFDASIIFHGGCSKVRLETQVQSRAYTPSPTVNESNYSDLRLMTYISETVTLRSLKEERLSQPRTTNISLKISDFCVDIYDDMETVPLQ